MSADVGFTMKKLQKKLLADTVNAGRLSRRLKFWKGKACLGVASLCFLIFTGVCTSGQQPTTPSPKPIFETGWKPDPVAAQKLSASQPAFIAKQVQALVEEASDKDALNYRFLAKCLNQPKLHPLDQGQLGACVGFAAAQSIDVVAAADIVHRRQREVFLSRASGGALYALGRTNARQLGNWEGSSGAWQVEAMQEDGTLWQQAYGEYDLTKYDIPLIKRWQQSGIPPVLIDKSKEHPVRGCHLIKNTSELKALLQNGYPCLSCASQSFGSKRDALGFSKGTKPGWSHAMAVISYRGKASGREGFLIWNSWDPQWISGPEWPSDMPLGSFWVSEQDMQARIDDGDSWGIGDLVGFKKRNLNWAEVLEIGGARK